MINTVGKKYKTNCLKCDRRFYFMSHNDEWAAFVKKLGLYCSDCEDKEIMTDE